MGWDMVPSWRVSQGGHDSLPMLAQMRPANALRLKMVTMRFTLRRATASNADAIANVYSASVGIFGENRLAAPGKPREPGLGAA